MLPLLATSPLVAWSGRHLLRALVPDSASAVMTAGDRYLFLRETKDVDIAKGVDLTE